MTSSPSAEQALPPQETRSLQEERRLIKGELRALERERQKALMALMTTYDATYHEKRRHLQARCAALGEHAWRFDDLGPTGRAWSTCVYCGARHVGPEEEAR